MNRCIWIVIGCALLPMGCGAQGGTLSGTVSHKKKLLAMGTVSVVNDQGHFGSGEIQPDGTYRIENCPAGKLKIAVFSPNPREVAARAAAPGGRNPPPGAVIPSPPQVDAAKWIAIPEMYSQPDNSGLLVEVSGDTVMNIELE